MQPFGRALACVGPATKSQSSPPTGTSAFKVGYVGDMTPEQPAPNFENAALEAELDRLRRELQEQLVHARAMLDQSRRLFNAAASEPRTFRRPQEN